MKKFIQTLLLVINFIFLEEIYRKIDFQHNNY